MTCYAECLTSTILLEKRGLSAGRSYRSENRLAQVQDGCRYGKKPSGQTFPAHCHRHVET